MIECQIEIYGERYQMMIAQKIKLASFDVTRPTVKYKLFEMFKKYVLCTDF